MDFSFEFLNIHIMKEERLAMISMVLNGKTNLSNFDCFSLLFDFFLVHLIMTAPIFLLLYLPTHPPTYLLSLTYLRTS
jgi:hypothetical protein